MRGKLAGIRWDGRWWRPKSIGLQAEGINNIVITFGLQAGVIVLSPLPQPHHHQPPTTDACPMIAPTIITIYITYLIIRSLRA